MTEPTKPSDGADPSMEEILASIRRILNDDETGAPAEPPAADPEPTAASAPAAETEADDDVLVLDRSMLVATPNDDPPPAAPEPTPAPVPAPAPEPAAIAIEPVAFSPPPPQPTDVEAPRARESALLAPETEAAAASSVDGLLRTLAASRSTHVYRGGPTIEDLVREEIRPLLKEWLDGHLPGLVERLVRAEIERVVGREVS